MTPNKFDASYTRYAETYLNAGLLSEKNGDHKRARESFGITRFLLSFVDTWDEASSAVQSQVSAKFDASYLRSAQEYHDAGIRSEKNGDHKGARESFRKARTALAIIDTSSEDSETLQEQLKAKVYPFDPSGATKSFEAGLRSGETRRKLPPRSALPDRDSPRL